jgi:DNA-3-methyladenine glycosylase
MHRRFFQQDVLQCARDLIGCELFWGECSGVVVETEAYAEHGDPACHTASRPSARAFIHDHPPGSAYVYFNYGMHWMLNVLTKSKTHGNGLILIRAIRPTAGTEEMRIRRTARLRREPPAHDRWLCSGPGKLAAALAVTGDDHGRDLCAGDGFGFRETREPKVDVLATPRIGISKAVDFLWRFHLAGDPYVSR